MSESCEGYTAYGATPGTCAGLAYEEECTSDGACTSGYCNDNLSNPVCDIYSPGSLYSLCQTDDDCTTGQCSDAGTCEKLGYQKACSDDVDCASGICNDYVSVCDNYSLGSSNSLCTNDAECISGYCNENLASPVCDDYLPGILLSTCDDDGDCDSNICNTNLSTPV